MNADDAGYAGKSRYNVGANLGIFEGRQQYLAAADAQVCTKAVSVPICVIAAIRVQGRTRDHPKC